VYLDAGALMGRLLGSVSQSGLGMTLSKIKALSARIEGVDRDLDQARAELDMLNHLEDDAMRDALVSENWDDKVDAKRAHADVQRCEKRIDRLTRDRSRLVDRRTWMIDKLAAQ
jgi:Spy/CpxP family protein refolding chaperone